MSIMKIEGFTFAMLEALLVACDRLRQEASFGIYASIQFAPGHYVFRQALNANGAIPRFEESELANPEYGYFYCSVANLNTLDQSDLDFADWAAEHCVKISHDDLCKAYSAGSSAFAYAAPLDLESLSQQALDEIAEVLCGQYACPLVELLDTHQDDAEAMEQAIFALKEQNLAYVVDGKCHLTRSGWIRAYRSLLDRHHRLVRVELTDYLDL